MPANSMLAQQKHPVASARKAGLPWIVTLRRAGSTAAEILLGAAVFLVLAGLDEPQRLVRIGLEAAMCIPALILWLRRRGRLQT